jgi:hypothetical protein
MCARPAQVGHGTSAHKNNEFRASLIRQVRPLRALQMRVLRRDRALCPGEMLFPVGVTDRARTTGRGDRAAIASTVEQGGAVGTVSCMKGSASGKADERVQPRYARFVSCRSAPLSRQPVPGRLVNARRGSWRSGLIRGLPASRTRPTPHRRAAAIIPTARAPSTRTCSWNSAIPVVQASTGSTTAMIGRDTRRWPAW